MSSAGAHTDERCRQPAFLPGPPPPQEVESSSGSAKVSGAPRCPSAGRARWDSPGRAEPCRAVPGSAEPSRAAPSPRVSLEGPRAPAQPRPAGRPRCRGVRGYPRGPARRRDAAAGDAAAGMHRRDAPAGMHRRVPRGERRGAAAAVRGPGRGYARSRSAAWPPAARGAPSAPGGCGSAGRAPAVLRLRRPARLLNSPLQNTAVCLVSGGIKILRGKTRK